MSDLKKLGINEFYKKIGKIVKHYDPKNGLIGLTATVTITQIGTHTIRGKLISLKHTHVRLKVKKNIITLPLSNYEVKISERNDKTYVVAKKKTEIQTEVEAIIIDQDLNGFFIEFYERGQVKRQWVDKKTVQFSCRFKDNTGHLKGFVTNQWTKKDE